MTRTNDSAGRPANGFVHDLNNLLTVINGYSELLLNCLDPADPNRKLVDEVLRAGARAAALMYQLQLPGRSKGAIMTAIPPVPRTPITVLLVEDEDAVRRLLRNLLENEGYRVLDAPGGPEALDLCLQETVPINLLITDVVMPIIGGQELAETLVQRFPSLRVLFVSGYTDEVIARRGVLKDRVTFMQKPFQLGEVMRVVREAMSKPLAG